MENTFPVKSQHYYHCYQTTSVLSSVDESV